MAEDNVDRERDEKDEEILERLRALEQRDAKRQKSGAAGQVLRGLGGLIPGLDSIVDGLEESEAFQERLATINAKLEAELGEASSRVGGERNPAHRTRCTETARAAAPNPPPSREPLVDVFDEGDHLLIVAELPGAAKQGIAIEVQEAGLVLSAGAPGRAYYKQVALPCPVQGEPATSYSNGVLQVTLAKRVG